MLEGQRKAASSFLFCVLGPERTGRQAQGSAILQISMLPRLLVRALPVLPACEGKDGGRCSRLTAGRGSDGSPFMVAPEGGLAG